MCSNLVFVKNHVGNTIDNRILAFAVGTNEFSFHDMGLKDSKKRYIKNDPVQFFEIFLIFNIFRGDVFGEVGFAELSNSFMKRKPVKFLNQSHNIVLVEIAFTIDRFFDLDQEWVVVLVALGYVADEQVVGKETH